MTQAVPAGQEVGFIPLPTAPQVGLEDFDKPLGLEELDDVGIGRAGLGSAGVTARRGQGLEVVGCKALGEQAPEAALEAKGLFDEEVDGAGYV